MGGVGRNNLIYSHFLVPYRTPESSVLPLSETFAQIGQIAEVPPADLAQSAVVLLNGLGQFILRVLDQ